MNGRRLLGASSAVAMALAFVAGAAPARSEGEVTVAEQDVFAYPEISLVVAGLSLATEDLTADAFEITENGVVVDADIERVDERLEVVVALDTSGSMAGPAMDAARGAASAFVDRLRPDTRVAVLGFGPAPSIALGFTNDRAAQHQAIGALTPSGETALYDAVTAAASLFDESGSARRAVVLLSDGGDTVSAGSIDDAVRAVANSSASLWVVSLTTPESDRSALDRLAGSTGGRVVPAGDPTALDAAYRAVAGDLAGRYRITFRSSASGIADVRVTVAGSTATAHLAYPGTGTTSPAGGTPLAPRDGNVLLLVAGAIAMFASFTLALAMFLLSRSSVRLTTKGERARAGLRGRIAGLAVRASAAAERGLDRQDRRRGVEATLEQAGIQLRAGEALVLAASAVVTGAVLASFVGGLVVAPLGGAVVAAACATTVAVLRSRRHRLFADQLEDLLQLVAGSLRAGYGLLQAIEMTSRELPSPAGDEMRRLTTEVRLGRDLAEALDGAAQRMANDDFEWAVQAIRIHREVGGDLAAVLDRVAETIRARTYVRRQVTALSAEGRLSAVILMIIPFGMLGVMSLTNPAYLGGLFRTTFGLTLVALGSVLMVMGAMWLRHIVRPVY